MKSCRFCEALSPLAIQESIVELKDGELYVGGLIPTDPQLDEFAREGHLLSKMNLWKLLTETVKAQALDMGIRQAKDFDQLMFAKAMLHVVGVQQAVIKAIVDERKRRKKADVL